MGESVARADLVKWAAAKPGQLVPFDGPPGTNFYSSLDGFRFGTLQAAMNRDAQVKLDEGAWTNLPDKRPTIWERINRWLNWAWDYD